MEDLIRAALTNALGAAVLGTIVAGLALILSRRPAVVHCLWVVVLLKLVTPPLFEVSVGRFDLEAPAPICVADAGAEAETDAEAEGPLTITIDADQLAAIDAAAAGWRPDLAAEACDPPCPPEVEAGPFIAAVGPAWPELARRGLVATWLAGSLATAVLAAVRIARFRRRLRDASPAGCRVEDQVAELSAAMGLKRPPAVDFIDARTTPMLWGLGTRPRLILPRALWKELDGRARTLLLTHELAHLKRGDHLLRLFELAVTILYWWLPVVWWVRRALRDVEEQCCDAWVVWMFPDDARAYAETLLDTVDFLNPSAEPEPLLASGFGKVQNLRKRLTMVMKGTTPRTLGWQGSLGALALAGVLLPLSPTWAQKSDEAPAAIEAVAAVDVFAAGADDDLSSTLTFRAVVDGDEVQTIDVSGPTTITAETVEVHGVDGAADVVVARVVGDDDDAEKDKAIAEEAKKEAKAAAEEAKKEAKAAAEEIKKEAKEIRREIRVQVSDDGNAEGRAEAVKKAVEQIKAQVKELEEKKGEGPAAEAQIKALKGAAEQLEKLARTPGAFTVRGMPSSGFGQAFTFQPEKLKVEPMHPDVKEFQLGRVVVRDPNDPKAAEARKKVEELSKVMAEKQKELAEAGKKLAEAHKELAKLQGDMVIKREFPDVAARLKEVRVAGDRLRLAEVRDRVEGDKEKARIDSLEAKLNKVLEELQGLKQPKDEGGKDKNKGDRVEH
ncbi:M56 family metallopeptidase [Paludisphaera soli]|uniref:M56 family metallopeptidase n=1 Tax=Paludisphaera soli TaxID=2712865 RepID=UPI0013EBDE9E|nr:M56 family metallopeptidase [Paludisphaera soli]